MNKHRIGSFAAACPFLAILLAAVLSSCGGGAASGSPGIDSGLTANPASGNAVSFFDAKGSTSAFGIPAGLNGTVSAGQQVFSTNCAGCHGTGSALPVLAFDTLKARLQTGPMASIPLIDQQIADLTAWLNRNSTPPATGGGGTPGVGSGGSGGDDDAEAGDDIGGATGGGDDAAGDDNGTTGSDDAAGDDSGTTGSDDIAPDDNGVDGSSGDAGDDSGAQGDD